MKSHSVALLAATLYLSSCQADSIGNTTRSRQGTAVITTMQPQVLPEKGKQMDDILVREWRYRDGTEYIDRNGDGMVDYEASGSTRGTDGYGVYKEDNDFDGFYDREYMGGGFAYSVVYDKPIREPVPQFHKIYPPTKVTKKPVSQTAPVSSGPPH